MKFRHFYFKIFPTLNIAIGFFGYSILMYFLMSQRKIGIHYFDSLASFNIKICIASGIAMTIIDRAVESFKGNPIREDSNLMLITAKT